MVAQEDFCLVGIESWTEGNLSSHLLYRGMAAGDGGSDRQRCLFHAQVFQLLICQPVHSNRAEVLACGEKAVLLCAQIPQSDLTL